MQKTKSVKTPYSDVLIVTGILFIIGSTVIGLAIKCPTQIQCFIVYTLIGVGMACIFKSAEQSSVSYKSLKFSFKIAGCIAVPMLLYIINPIDKIKANGCDSPTNITISVPGTNSPKDTVLQQQSHEKAPDLSKIYTPGLNHPKPSPIKSINKPGEQGFSVQCNGLTKRGTRCKHYTYISNGFCSQHQPG
ncbi:MAG TPA: hypothetical protein VF008_26705 [Niastella sp.]